MNEAYLFKNIVILIGLSMVQFMLCTQIVWLLNESYGHSCAIYLSKKVTFTAESNLKFVLRNYDEDFGYGTASKRAIRSVNFHVKLELDVLRSL